MEKFTLHQSVEPTNKHELSYGFDSDIQIGDKPTNFINVFHENEDECKKITAVVLNAQEMLDVLKDVEKYFDGDSMSQHEELELVIFIKDVIKKSQEL